MSYVKKRSLSFVTAVALVLALFAMLPEGALKAHALKLQNGTLTLSGNVSLSEVKSYQDNPAVKKVVADSTAVMPADCSGMFEAWWALEEIDLSKANFTNVTSMNHMFNDNYDLKKVNLSGIKTPNLKDVGEFFIYDDALLELDLSSMDFSGVTSLKNVFRGCKSLQTINLGTMSTASVTSMIGTFKECQSLTSLDLSTFNTAKVTDMSEMFYGCYNLVTIYGPAEWSFAGLRNHDLANNTMEMFFGCSALVGGNGTRYSSTMINGTYARIDKAGAPGYFTAGSASSETKYSLEINGIYAAPSNASNILGDGKFSYNDSTKTLTVNGGTYSNGKIINHGIKNLKIIISNETTLSSIRVTENTTITGSGTLRLSSGISAESPLTNGIELKIDGANIVISGSSTFISGSGRTGREEKLTINNSNVTVSGSVTGFMDGISITNCYLVQPSGAAVSGSSITAGGSTATNIKISTTQASQRLLGDMNNDGKVTADDAIIAARLAAGYGDYSIRYSSKVGDMNGDNKVTADDAIIIARVAAGYGDYATRYNKYVTL